ncbi:alpha/beta fold hydrolase [Dyella humicola]|uniref:alpha/beta fold hydrolase n=1 Tax=Dyella humicola TaxID=2992126 RepID=UPI002255CE3D|nr:alpha/beta hydrolase [Dyella humicola]
MTMRTEAEHPFFFGDRSELFGIYHAAAPAAGKAVLLCAPLGQDQIRCHRLYRQLAHALAAEGIPALRFDYYGCGDSLGTSAEVRWDRCIRDTVTAANELRARCGIDRVVAFGARLGGNMALAAFAAARFADIVVWDPVIDGQAHVATLDAMQEALRQDTRRFIKPRPAAFADEQWLGFAVNPELRAQISGLGVGWKATPSLLLDSLPASSSHAWRAVAVDDASIKVLQPSTPWDDLARLEVAILSHPLVQTVTAHLRGAHG